MHDIQLRSLKQWMAVMDKWGVQYKIITPDGQEFGALEVAAPRTRKAGLYPVNTLRDYFLPFIEKMEAGDVVVVPFGGFDGVPLRGSLAAWAVAHWGKGSATTHLNFDKKHVEILRLS